MVYIFMISSIFEIKEIDAIFEYVPHDHELSYLIHYSCLSNSFNSV